MAGYENILANFPKIQDASYKFFWQEYANQPATRYKIFQNKKPMGLDPMSVFYRQVVGFLSVNLKPRGATDPIQPKSGMVEDFSWQIKMRRIVDAALIDPDLVNYRNEGMVVGFVQKWTAEFAEAANRYMEDFAAKYIQYGALTAGSINHFNNGVPGFEDPYPAVGYDGLPLFDGAHVQSRLVTATTYANISTARSWSRDNLATTVKTMRTTNAYDRNGSEIVIVPNMIMAHPDLEFDIERDLGSTVLNADQQKNVLGQDYRWERVYWRFFGDSNGWMVGEQAPGGGCKGLYFFEWRAPEIRISYNEKNKCNEITGEVFFGCSHDDWRFLFLNNVADV